MRIRMRLHRCLVKMLIGLFLEMDGFPGLEGRFGRTGAADFIRDLRKFTTPIRVSVRAIVTEAENAVALLDLETRVTHTGKVIKTEAAFDFTVRDGQLCGFRLFEDSYAVSQAVIEKNGRAA